MNIKLGFADEVEKHNADTLRQLEEVLSLDKDIILSGEAISSLNREELTSLKSFLKRFNKELEVICFVRKPYAFYLSALQELIKEGRGTLNSLNVPHFYRRLQALKDVFGGISFLSFEMSCKQEAGPVQAFLKQINIKPEANGVDDLKNASIGNLSTRLYAHINETFPLIVDGRLNNERPSFKIKQFDNSKFLLTKQELKKVKSELDFVNNEISNLLGNQFTDDEYEVSDKLNLNDRQKDDILSFFKNSSAIFSFVSEFVAKHGGFGALSKVKILTKQRFIKLCKRIFS